MDAAQVTPEASFVDDLGADSLDTVELVMAFEEEFNIQIPDEDAEKIQKVKDAYDYIEKHASEKLVNASSRSLHAAWLSRSWVWFPRSGSATRRTGRP